MTLRIPTLLASLLDAVASEAAAKATQTRIRKALAAEARRRYAEEGAAPTWKASGSGTVRWDEPAPLAPVVADPAAFGSYVAEHYPTEAEAVIRLAPTELEAALAALEFAGIRDATTAVEVRPSGRDAILARLEHTTTGEDDVDGALDVDEATGETRIVPGVAWQRSHTGKLVVSLDAIRKRDAIAAATTAAEAVVESAVITAEGPDVAEPIGTAVAEPPLAVPHPAGEVRMTFASALGASTVVEALPDGVLRRLADRKSDDLKRAARVKGLPVGGTKVELATRLLAAGVTDADLDDLLKVA